MASAPPPPPPLLLTPKPDPDAPPTQFPTTLAVLTPKPDPDAPPTPFPTTALALAVLPPKPDPSAPAVTPDLCALWRSQLDPSPDDHPDFARYLRLTQHRLNNISATLAAAPPPPDPHPQPQGSIPLPLHAAASSSATRKVAPASEMVRFTNANPGGFIYSRQLVRRARLTFEALRGIYQRQDSFDGTRNRFDLRASSKMLSEGLWLYRNVRIVGSIPGVLVGDAFYYRAELCVVGLHLAPQAGIGYIPGRLVSEGHPVATSIVSSGGYHDNEDSGDVLVYTGSGGRQRNRVEHHADQTLERGNLALHYSCQYGIEVRVIRCHACEASPSHKVYVYDGLYKVVDSTYGPGKSGRDVCKYKLVRLPGQEELGSKSWYLAKDLKDTLDSKIRPHGYISLDLSKGKEACRIPVRNKVDQERSLLDFEYIAHPEFPVATPTVKRHKGGCHCQDGICGSKCSCARKNKGGPVYNENGTLIRGRSVVYECGAQCGCPMSCFNRVTQQGMKQRLEVFRSRETEWGVRTLDMIQPGAFVCEYSGDVVGSDALMSESCFIDPNRFPKRWKEWGDASAVLPDNNGPQIPQFPAPGYVFDVSRRRNFASYISHSCAPNVFVQFVVRGNENPSFPHLVVFAMDTIPPMRELSIDYGIDQQST